MIDKQLAIESIHEVMWDALGICEDWCKTEDYDYSFSDLIAVTRLILEEKERCRIINED